MHHNANPRSPKSASSITTMSILAEILVLTTLYTVISHYARKRLRSLPPGPLGIPFVGNLLDLPKYEQWRRVIAWSKKYGDVIYLQVLGTPLIYLNSAEATGDLLDARGAIYSDRPVLTMASEMCDMKDLAPLTRYGPRFQSQRRLMHSVLSTSAIDAWQSAVVQETNTLLRQILKHPDGYVSHINRMAGSLIFRVMYGYQVSKNHDPFITGAEELMVKSSWIISSPWLVDFVPMLKLLPGTKWRKIASDFRAKLYDWVERPHEMFKSLPNSQAKQASFCGKLLLDQNGVLLHTDTEYEHDVKWIATSVYGAASDTTAITLTQLILAMVHHPEVLAKAQAQIDEVVGSSRLPTFDDRAKLPYIECIFKEVLRWGAAVPLTPPHVLTQDDSYRGYNLPKGSYCIANIW